MLPPLADVADEASSVVNPSPKRKRSDSADPATAAALSTFAPRLNTNVSTVAQNNSLTCVSEPAPGSPRSLVAARLSDLQIKELRPSLPVLQFGATDDEPSKRIKRAVEFEDVRDVGNPKGKILDRPEAAETRPPSQNGSGPGSIAASSKSDIAAVIESNRALTPKPFSSAHKPVSPPPALADLVWKDSEITGHLMADPDDDGTGINGIGFKPTPAIQYAREQKRKQQLHDWKLREAREARQKRSERRRGRAAAEEKEAVEGAIRRMVRFADALKG